MEADVDRDELGCETTCGEDVQMWLKRRKRAAGNGILRAVAARNRSL
jgi:hypothetical protein